MHDHGFQIEFTPVEWLDVYVIVIIKNVWFLFILWTIMIQKFWLFTFFWSNSMIQKFWLFTFFWSNSFQAKTAFEADIDCVQEIADFYRFGVHYAKVTFCYKETIIPNPKSVYFVDFVVY